MSIRQSPFRRQTSQSPAPTIRPTSSASNNNITPTASPTKPSATLLSPLTRTNSLSPEKQSPFVRRPSQIGHVGSQNERPASPFARPGSSLAFSSSMSPPPKASVGEVMKASARSGSDESASTSSTPSSPTRRTIEERTRAFSPAPPESPSPFDGPDTPSLDSPFTETIVPNQTSLRPAAPRTLTSSTISTIRQPTFHPTPNQAIKLTTTSIPLSSRTMRPFNNNNSHAAYTSLPAPLVRNLRESFEVLDSSATGSLTSSSLPPTLDQLGLPSDPRSLADFFPSSQPQSLNLASYLDLLSSPLASLSQPEELLAAFGAFDVDDSGQIDARELREALLTTAPEPALADLGEEVGCRLSESEVDAVLAEFVGRRAFGAATKSLGQNGVKNGKGDVFRYRDFMASVGGVGGAGDAGQAVAA